jgi:hypothetical protein
MRTYGIRLAWLTTALIILAAILPLIALAGDGDPRGG